MTEVNYILNTMTHHSLIIIDELCRSTSVDEGTALAMAICEDFASSGAYIYVTTHYTLLTKLANLFLNIKIWQMQTVPSGDINNPKTMKLDFKFALMPGVTTLKGYGIYMARNVWPDAVMKYVDKLQELLTEKPEDPEFPELDKPIHLKHDLVCKLEKLKLQKKYTVANINKYLDEYNREVSKLGEKCQNSQIAIEIPDFLMGENTAPNVDLFPELESILYLDNFQEALSSVASSKQSFIKIKQERGADNTEEMVFSPVSIHESCQSLTFSPNKSINRMKALLIPNTNLDMSTSTYHSFDSKQNMKMVVPAVNISCSASDCSLNFTQDALNLNKNDSYESNNVKDTYSMTQVPEPVLSFRLETNRSFENESPYTKTFAGPLQSDTNRTSTPLITKIQHNARSFGSSASNIVQSIDNQVETRNNTPKPYFTINNDVRDVDIQSAQEDLKSFVEYIQNKDSNSPEDVKKNDTEERNEFKLKPKESEISLMSKNTDESTKKYIRKYNNKHIVPAVKIIEGLNNSSFEDKNSQFNEGKEIIVRPVIKNLQVKNQESNKLFKASNSLANPKCIIFSLNMPSPSETKKNTTQLLQNNEENEKNQHKICNFKDTGCYCKNFQEAIFKDLSCVSNSIETVRKLNEKKLTNVKKNIVDENATNTIVGLLESSSEDLFNTAESSLSFGYSPLALRIKGVHENIISSEDMLQGNVYQKFNSCKKENKEPVAQSKEKINNLEEEQKITDTMKGLNDESKSGAVNVDDKRITGFKRLNVGDISDKSSFGSLEISNQEHKHSTNSEQIKPGNQIIISEILEMDRMETEKGNHIVDHIKSNFNAEAILNNIQKSSSEQQDESVEVIIRQKLINGSTEFRSAFATDEITVANQNLFANRTFEIKECTEAVQKESDLLEKLRGMQNETMQENTTIKVIPAHHIPHLTAYCSNFSENTDKEQTVFKNYPNQENQETLKNKKVYSKRSTLGIAKKISKQLGKKKKPSNDDVKETKNGQTKKQNKSENVCLECNDNEKEKSLDSLNNQDLFAKESTNINKSVTLAQQSKTVDEKTLTSVSEASKLRNLDEDLSSSSSGVKKDFVKSYKVSQEKTVSTGISEASRKRNLDQLTTSSDKKKSNNKDTSDDISFKSVGCNEPNKNERKKDKIYRGSWSKSAVSSRKNTVIDENGGSPERSKLKFIPPSKLSTKALREVFFEQDKKFFKTSGSSAELAKIWEQRLNRPSLKQFKNSSCVATIRKTQAGVEVIPEKERQKRKYLRSKNRTLSSSDSSVNMNIFSDKNAQTFEQFIKSKKTDYKSFNFNFGYEEASTRRADGNMFDFKQVNAVSSEYTQKSFSLTFVKRRSEEFPSSQQSTSNHTFLTPNVDFSLTPDGFYKQNRNDINSIINKYK